MNLLEIRKLNLSLSKRPVLREMELSLERGQLLGLVGPNGAGKSSLLKVLAGLLKPESGEMLLEGQHLGKLLGEQKARRIAYLAQERTAHWPLRVERVVALGRFPHIAHWQSPTEQDQLIIEQAMRAADVLQFRQRRISNLSGGEQMRVLLARALAVQADILLADEPITALDPAHALSVMQLLRTICEHGNSVIAVMHDLTLSARYCHKLVLMDEGTVIASGEPRDVFTSDNLKRVYQIEVYQGTEGEVPIVPWNLS